MKCNKPITGLILLTFSFIFLAGGSSNNVYAQATQDEVHVVQQGETLFSISRIYNITVGDLRRWNDLENDALSVGMELRIAPPATGNTIIHTVQPRETLFSISRQYGVTIAEIQQWNNLEDNLLDVGQDLTIYTQQEITGEQLPATPEQQTQPIEERRSIVTSPAQANTYYTVRSGDTLTKIANEHDMTVRELRQLNELEGDMLSIGQRLIVREIQSTPVVDEDIEESTPQGRFVTYRVRQGEDTESLLDRFQMNLDELQALNPGVDFSSLRNQQRITVLLPPSRSFRNPYRKRAGMRDLGRVHVQRYSTGDYASPTTSGELYNPTQLTAAHSNMALGEVVYIENPSNGIGIHVKINDRISGDGLKLSQKAYEMLQFSSIERATVTIYLDD